MWLYVALAVICYLSYSYLYRPWKLFRWYGDTLEKLGYSVYKVKWRPLGGQIVKLTRQGYQKHGDVNYFWKNCQQYDVVLSNVFYQPLLLIVNADLLKQFYAPDKVYVYHKSDRVSGVFPKLIGIGIIFDEQQSWKKRRKTLNNVFTYQFVKGMTPLVIQQIDRTFKENEVSDKFPSLYIYPDIYAKTLGVVTVKSFFGQQILSKKFDGQTLPNFMLDFATQMNHLSRSLDIFFFGTMAIDLGYRAVTRAVKRKKKILHDTIRQFIREQVSEVEKIGYENVKKKNIISEICRINSTAQNPEDKYTQEEIVGQFTNIFFAGLDTTSQLLTMMTYYMALYPETREKVLAQMEKYIKSEEDINPQNLKNMVYLEGVQKETLRMYGPANGTFIREATANHKLKDIPIWKGTMVSAVTITNNFNEKYFQNAAQFNPERWLNDKENERHPFAYVAFSAGPRSCLGKQLALLESKIFMIKFLRRYTYELQNKQFRMIFGGLGYIPEKINTILKVIQ